MPELSIEQFSAFFHGITDHDPFLWQVRLAEEVAAHGWPDVLDLPTASGKTAALEIAVFTLALESELPLAERRAPRRIFFVVDRRIVVDQAFERAGIIARALAEPGENGPAAVRAVADRLKNLASPGFDPLGHERLRGGMPRTNAWTRAPSQPAIIACTVDQLGSRLLFRSYDGSPLMAPVYAGLAANDSLIILDEAHCALPFLETTTAIQRFRRWAAVPLETPFQLVSLSATPHLDEGIGVSVTDKADGPDSSPGIEGSAAHKQSSRIFRLTDQEWKDKALEPRLTGRKPAALVFATKAKVPRGGGAAEVREARSRLGEELASWAMDFLTRRDRRRIAVIVNRVATAIDVRERIIDSLGGNDTGAAVVDCEVVLMTGRMRPLDRDDLIHTWAERLRAGGLRSENEPPVIVVSTQSLEVGADFDFDALVTEAASLDALRQRFGRLDRLGTDGSAPGAIVIGAYQAKDSSDDPVYGAAIGRTWEWLTGIAVSDPPAPWSDDPPKGVTEFVDLGIEAIGPELGKVTIEEMLAPAEPAPVMLPTHVDRWAQTSPQPDPTPDPSVFLHGPGPIAAEVNVLWRLDLTAPADMSPEEAATKIDLALGLCPPSALESLPVSIGWLRRWMREQPEIPIDDSDVEGRGTSEETREARRHATRKVIIWRAGEAQVIRDPGAIRPGDFAIIPEAYGGNFERLLRWQRGRDPIFDLGDRAQQTARGRAVLRIHSAAIRAWPISEHGAARTRLRTLLEATHEVERSTVLEILVDLAAELASSAREDHWLAHVVTGLLNDHRVAIEMHPLGGFILRGTPGSGINPGGSTGIATPSEADIPGDPDRLSESTGDVALDAHLDGVQRVAGALAERCGLPKQIRADVILAARLHDIGKADPRFQAMLRGDGLAVPLQPDELLAKSAEVPHTAAAYRRLADRAELPRGFRHELISMRLAESLDQVLDDANDRALVLHLIASHHGHCRPFAPAVRDDSPVPVRYERDDLTAEAMSATELHRLGSGAPDRFWTLIGRYGWWGLAYLEAILRIADQLQSAAERTPPRDDAVAATTSVPAVAVG